MTVNTNQPLGPPWWEYRVNCLPCDMVGIEEVAVKAAEEWIGRIVWRLAYSTMVFI